MKLKDILKLEKNEYSLNEIRNFLSQPLALSDYQIAFIYMLNMLNHLGFYKLTISDGEELISRMNQQKDSLNYEAALKEMVDASIALEDFDRAIEYILKRKESLPIIRQYLSIMDEIKLKKARGLPYTEEIRSALSDALPTSVRLELLSDLLLVKMKENDIEESLGIIDQIFELDDRAPFFKERYELLCEKGEYDRVKELAEEFINVDEQKAISFVYLLKMYITSSDFHKAIILETDYEDFIENQNDEIRLMAYELLLEMYESINNKLSIENYKKKLSKIQRKKKIDIIEKIEQTQEENTLEKPQQVIIEPIVKKDKRTFSEIAVQLEKVNDLLIYSHQLNANLPLRDFFRTFFIYLETKVSFKEIVVYVNDENHNFFHYKQERLFDKRVIPGLLENTVIEHVKDKLEEVFDSIDTIKWQKNPITLKDYLEEIKYVLALPIVDVGVILVHFDDKQKDPSIHYDIFKVVSSIVYARLVDEKNIIRQKAENNFLNNILKSNFLPFRIQSEYYAVYNDLAKTIFDCDAHLAIQDFYNFIDNSNVHEYRSMIRRLLVATKEKHILTYSFKGKIIKESALSLKDGDETKIISVFEDITADVNKSNDLITKTNLDFETNLANIHALNEKFSDYFEDKVSFIMIRTNKDLDKIYGGEKAKFYFKEFAQVTKKFFNEGDTYRFNEDTLFVCIYTNDIRTTTKIVKDYQRHIREGESQTIKYEHFSAEIGVLRYPVVTVEKNINKIYRFLSIALNKAKNTDEGLSFFSFSDYEEDVFEIQVIDLINTALETNNVSLNFIQITDIQNKKIWQYESELSIPNLRIDSKYLVTIAKKRNRILELERHHVETVAKFLYKLGEETNRLVKVTIPISKDSIVDSQFQSFLIGVFKKYNIDLNFIRLRIDGKLKSSYSQNIRDLREFGIGVDTNDIEMALSYPFDAYHYELKNVDLKHLDYLAKLGESLENNKMSLVVRNVTDRNHRDMLSKAGVKYIEGNLYKTIPAIELLGKIKEAYEDN